ncbi:hypothetical protein J6590_015979 [Homalodisca vitripennis]|nr:hypothetical protein J6590_015979 [Homalodisca vitripennis]
MLTQFMIFQIALENIGRWEWKWITKTNNTKHWGMAHSITRPTGMKDGEFSCVVYYTSKFGYYKIYSQYLIYDLGYGRAYGKAFGSNMDVEIYVLKHVPHKYVCLYFCSHNGNDVILDYRVVLTHKNCLTSAELLEIEAIEKYYNFDGELMELETDDLGKAYL